MRKLPVPPPASRVVLIFFFFGADIFRSALQLGPEKLREVCQAGSVDEA